MVALFEPMLKCNSKLQGTVLSTALSPVPKAVPISESMEPMNSKHLVHADEVSGSLLKTFTWIKRLKHLLLENCVTFLVHYYPNDCRTRKK